MKGIATFAFFGLYLVPAAMPAQVGLNPLSVRAGTRARITSAPDTKDYVELTVVSTDRDTLRYHAPNSEATKALAWSQISRMDVSEGVHRHIGTGLFLGFVGGAAAGALLGAATSGGDNETQAFATFGGAVGGAAAGAVLGAVIGFAQRSERWTSVALSH